MNLYLIESDSDVPRYVEAEDFHDALAVHLEWWVRYEGDSEPTVEQVVLVSDEPEGVIRRDTRKGILNPN